MALISPRHLLAPFLNKTHLFTMIGVVLLFIAFRFSGGGIKTQKSGKTQDLQVEESVPEAAVSKKPAQHVEDDAIDNALDSAGSDSHAQKQPAPETDRKQQAPSKDSGSLDDIERAMGLR
jgi:hypothetical protein